MNSEVTCPECNTTSTNHELIDEEYLPDFYGGVYGCNTYKCVSCSTTFSETFDFDYEIFIKYTNKK